MEFSRPVNQKPTPDAPISGIKRVGAVLNTPLSELFAPPRDTVQEGRRCVVSNTSEQILSKISFYEATVSTLRDLWRASRQQVCIRAGMALLDATVRVAPPIITSWYLQGAPDGWRISLPVLLLSGWVASEVSTLINQRFGGAFNRSTFQTLDRGFMNSLPKHTDESMEVSEHQDLLVKTREDFNRVANFAERNFKLVTDTVVFGAASFALLIKQPVIATAFVLCGIWQVVHEYRGLKEASKTATETASARRSWWFLRYARIVVKGIAEGKNLGKSEPLVTTACAAGEAIDRRRAEDDARHALRSVSTSVTTLAIKGVALCNAMINPTLGIGEIIGAVALLYPLESATRSFSRAFGEHILDLEYVKSKLALEKGGVKEIDPTVEYKALDSSVAPEITLSNVSWKRGGKKILDGISLSLRPGGIYGICGPSGAGKSSLLKILVGARSPAEGTVSLNGTLRGEFHPEMVRGLFGYMPQDPEAFESYRVIDAIRLGAPGANRTELQNLTIPRASEVAKADFLKNPEDYTSRIGAQFENGRSFSGGESKRIALIRYLMKQARVLILDEPTEGLDAITEKKVIEGLRDHAQATGCTVVLVSHHYVNFAKAQVDEIFYLEDGKIEERGSHAELIKLEKGKYREMFEAERRPYLDPGPM